MRAFLTESGMDAANVGLTRYASILSVKITVIDWHNVLAISGM